MASNKLQLHSDVSELTRALCDIESVSGNEAELCDAIFEALSGFSHLSLYRDGNAVVAKTETGRDSRVIIAGHIDTVPVANNLPSRLLHLEREQVIFGRGSVDMKAGVAVMLKLAAELSSPKFDITWIFYDLEEVEAERNGLARIARHHPELVEGDFAVLCEPTAARIEGGCNGTMRAELSFQGVKAHSARPWMGENAIHKMTKALAILAEHQSETISVDSLDYRESLNAVSVSGGVASNVIPDSAKLTVNFRFAPSRSEAEAELYLRNLFPGVELSIVDSAPGARPGLNHPTAQQFVQAVQAEIGPKYGWTDVARFSALGIPAVNYGPGDPNKAHADDEALPVSQLYACEAGLRGWLA